MKTWIVATVMMVGLTMTAQPRGERGRDNERHAPREQREQFTAQQRSELKAKQLTLALNLTDKQQKDVQKLLLTKETEKDQLRAQHKADHDAGKKPTAEERFAFKNKMLDDKIATQREFKKILTDEQFASFEKMKDERHGPHGRGGKDFKRNARR